MDDTTETQPNITSLDEPKAISPTNQTNTTRPSQGEELAEALYEWLNKNAGDLWRNDKH